jgi:hypothetical protein
LIYGCIYINFAGTASSVAGDDRTSLASWMSSELAAAERQITAVVGGGGQQEEIALIEIPDDTDDGPGPGGHSQDIKFYIGEEDAGSSGIIGMF